MWSSSRLTPLTEPTEPTEPTAPTEPASVDGAGGAPADAELTTVLEAARDLGLLGPGPVAVHIALADGMARAVLEQLETPPPTVIDLGSGAGVPGLVLALRWAAARVVLLEASARRIAWLTDAIHTLGLGQRCDVAHGRAEDLARTDLRGAFSLVTARGFAPPPVTAECAAGFVAPGGLVAVAEPPIPEAERWPATPLASLGLEVASRSTEPSVCVLRRIGPVPDRYPRRTGIPAKRPLWEVGADR